ncbi:hypothetical protein SORBI_3005G091400, partial [Sorghum bicolor]
RSKAQEEKLEDHSALYWRQRLLPSLLPDVFCPLLGEELRCMHRHHARSTRGRRSVAPASQLHRVPVLPRVPAIAQAVVGNGDFGDAHQLLDALPARFVHQDQPLFLSISLAGISDSASRPPPYTSTASNISPVCRSIVFFFLFIVLADVVSFHFHLFSLAWTSVHRAYCTWP